MCIRDSVTVNAAVANSAPVAVDDDIETAEETAVVIMVLSNDTDADGDTLGVSAAGVQTTPSNGSAAITDEGTTVTYTPDAGFSGLDSFTYEVSDGKGGTATGTVNVTVNAAVTNSAPVAVDDDIETAEETSVVIMVLANDTDADGDTSEGTRLQKEIDNLYERYAQ